MERYRLWPMMMVLFLTLACGQSQISNLNQDPIDDDNGGSLQEPDESEDNENPFPYTLKRGRENVPPEDQVTIPNLNPKTIVKMTIPDAEERDAVCNDGSPGIFYARPGKDSDKWLIFLEGGGSCFSLETCSERIRTTPWLMTSKDEPGTLNKNGIFDGTSPINPLAQANVIYISYCTSDVFANSVDASDSPMPGVSFHGRDILNAIFEDLQSQKYKSLPDLDDASAILFGGVSAGGSGALNYTPFLADRLPTSVALFSLIDSAGGEIDTFNNPEHYETERNLAENEGEKYLNFSSVMTDLILGKKDPLVYLEELEKSPNYNPVLTDNGYFLGNGASAMWSKQAGKHYYPPCSNRAVKEHLPISICNNTLYLIRNFTTPVIYMGALRDHHTLGVRGIPEGQHDKYKDEVNQFGHDKIKAFLNIVRPQDALFLLDDTFHGGVHANNFYAAINETPFFKFLMQWLMGENQENILIEHPEKYGFDGDEIN